MAAGKRHLSLKKSRQIAIKVMPLDASITPLTRDGPPPA